MRVHGRSWTNKSALDRRYEREMWINTCRIFNSADIGSKRPAEKMESSESMDINSFGWPFTWARSEI